MRILVLFLMMTFPSVYSTCAAEDLGEAADKKIAAVAVETGIVGISAAISVDGEIVWSGGAGYRDRERHVPATGEMRHRIASITKAMTSTAVMQLVERGAIRLDDPLRKHLPAFPAKDRGEIQIFHLLTHSSGMRHYRGAENRPMTHYVTLTDALEVFQDRRLAFEPGSRFLYTTYGYTTLGAVIEAVSGMTYEAYMREHVWGPAGMERTGLEVHGNAHPDQSKLYRRGKDEAVVEDDYTDLSVKYPGGGVVSTAGDLLRFANAFMDGALVETETRDRMLVVPPLERRRVPYALGWMVFESDSLGRVIHQDGGQAGTSTALEIFPEHRIAVAVLANVARAGSEVGLLTRELGQLAAGVR